MTRMTDKEWMQHELNRMVKAEGGKVSVERMTEIVSELSQRLRENPNLPREMNTLTPDELIARARKASGEERYRIIKRVLRIEPENITAACMRVEYLAQNADDRVHHYEDLTRKATERLAEEGLPISLSISLHAPTEELRSSLMPVNRMYPMAEVLRAAELYAAQTKRRVTYEYILIRDVNDGVREAEQLARLLRGQLASVNLIPINPVAERHLFRPPRETVLRFQRILEAHHVTATVRREMGTDIQAACGQLRSRLMEAGL